MKKRSDTITLIYLPSKTGKPYSIELSLKAAKLVVISVAGILLLSTLTSFLTVNLYLRNDRLADEMLVLRNDKKLLTERLLVMDRVLVDNYNKEKEMSEKPQTKHAVEINTSKLPKLRIDSIRIGRAKEQDTFKLTYKVVNTAPSKDKLKGYMIVSYKRDYGYFTIPEGIAFVGGAPKKFDEGEPFSIRYFKPIEKMILYPIDTVKSLNVWLFDEAGALILKHKVWPK